jgi:DNA-binding response OmpR family regulator
MLSMRSVLIVEDDLLLADIHQDALTTASYTVSGIAQTVEEAILSVECQPPHFAIIDVNLANGDAGADVGMHLRATAKIGIIFSTGHNDPEVNHLMGDAVLTKPYRLEDMARGLEIIGELAEFGQTDLAFPPNFRLLGPALT